MLVPRNRESAKTNRRVARQPLKHDWIAMTLSDKSAQRSSAGIEDQLRIDSGAEDDTRIEHLPRRSKEQDQRITTGRLAAKPGPLRSQALILGHHLTDNRPRVTHALPSKHLLGGHRPSHKLPHIGLRRLRKQLAALICLAKELQERRLLKHSLGPGITGAVGRVTDPPHPRRQPARLSIDHPRRRQPSTRLARGQPLLDPDRPRRDRHLTGRRPQQQEPKSMLTRELARRTTALERRLRQIDLRLIRLLPTPLTQTPNRPLVLPQPDHERGDARPCPAFDADASGASASTCCGVQLGIYSIEPNSEQLGGSTPSANRGCRTLEPDSATPERRET